MDLATLKTAEGFKEAVNSIYDGYKEVTWITVNDEEFAVLPVRDSGLAFVDEDGISTVYTWKEING